MQLPADFCMLFPHYCSDGRASTIFYIASALTILAVIAVSFLHGTNINDGLAYSAFFAMISAVGIVTSVLLLSVFVEALIVFGAVRLGAGIAAVIFLSVVLGRVLESRCY